MLTIWDVINRTIGGYEGDWKEAIKVINSASRIIPAIEDDFMDEIINLMSSGAMVIPLGVASSVLADEGNRIVGENVFKADIGYLKFEIELNGEINLDECDDEEKRFIEFLVKKANGVKNV